MPFMTLFAARTTRRERCRRERAKRLEVAGLGDDEVGQSELEARAVDRERREPAREVGAARGRSRSGSREERNRTRSRAKPTTKQTVGATDDRLGREEAMSALQKTIIAVNPTSPGSISRNGVIEAPNG